MAVYIIIFLLIAVFAIDYEFNHNRSVYPLYFIAFVLILLAGFRHPSIDRDHENYLYSFQSIYEGTDFFIYAIHEPGFVLIVNIVRSIIKYNYDIVIMVLYAFASVLIRTISIQKLAINPFVVMLFYFSHYFILQEMTQIRIGLASAIFFIALIFFLKGKTRQYFWLILLATMFHYTAILYMALLFLKKDSFNRYLYVFIIVLAVAFSFVKVPLLNYLGAIESSEYTLKIDNYTTAAEYANKQVHVLNLITIANIFCCLYLILAVAPGGFAEDKKLTITLKCNVISIFLLSFFAGIPSLSFRVSELFGILSMFCFAYLTRYLPFGKYNIFVVIIIAAIFFYYFILVGDLIKPYKIVDFKRSYI